jgi:hypothetical protein
LKFLRNLCLVDFAAGSTPAFLKDEVRYLQHDFGQLDVLVSLERNEVKEGVAAAGASSGLDVFHLGWREQLLAVAFVAFLAARLSFLSSPSCPSSYQMGCRKREAGQSWRSSPFS